MLEIGGICWHSKKEQSEKADFSKKTIDFVDLAVGDFCQVHTRCFLLGGNLFGERESKYAQKGSSAPLPAGEGFP
jgi:hypothetical protein